MSHHHFLLSPGCWLGQGNIQLSLVAEELSFATLWNIGSPDSEGRIECTQEIQIKGLSDVMRNQFNIFDMNCGEFQIQLENDALGRVTGKGVINDKIIAWEFRVEEIGFEGFELYEKEDEENYLMRAEYATEDQFRTLIRGKVWKKMQPKTQKDA